MSRQVELPFRCGIDGSEWEASLEPVGPLLGFVGFRQPGHSVELPPVDRAAELRRRLQELASAKAPLPPPRSSDIVQQERSFKLTDDQITDFGFKCPSCGNLQLLLCPICSKFSCRGAKRDEAGRIQCRWCGGTLWFKTAAGDGQKAPPTAIDATADVTGLRHRELPPGNTK